MGQAPSAFLSATNPSLAHMQQMGALAAAGVSATNHQNGKCVGNFMSRHLVQFLLYHSRFKIWVNSHDNNLPFNLYNADCWIILCQCRFNGLSRVGTKAKIVLARSLVKSFGLNKRSKVYYFAKKYLESEHFRLASLPSIQNSNNWSQSAYNFKIMFSWQLQRTAYRIMYIYLLKFKIN